MGVGFAHPRRKNFKTLEAIELLILNFSMASKTFFRLKQHHPANSVHVQITHLKTWLGMTNQLILIFERHLRLLGLSKGMDLEIF